MTSRSPPTRGGSTSPYACVTSDAARGVRHRARSRSPARACSPTPTRSRSTAERVRVRAADGARTELAARAVIDARGPDAGAPSACGWQKFLGQELVLAAPHGLDRADADGRDRAAARRLPLHLRAAARRRPAARRGHVLQRRRRTSTSRLLRERDRARTSARAAGRSPRVEREEVGVLPLPWQCAPPSPSAPRSSPATRAAGFTPSPATRSRSPRGSPPLVATRPAAELFGAALVDHARGARAPAPVRAPAQPDAVPLVPAGPALPRARAVLPAARAGDPPVLRARADARSIARASSSVDRRAACRCARRSAWRPREAARDPHHAPDPDRRARSRARRPAARARSTPRCPPRCGGARSRARPTEFLSRPGKELRTTIVRAGWLLGGGEPAAMPDRLPLVIELLHAGSLIIDDVEDGSDERRGAPALHHVVGVPLAINTGSWMYFWALAELAELGLPPATELAAHRAAAATLVRCHQGQALDLATRIARSRARRRRRRGRRDHAAQDRRAVQARRRARRARRGCAARDRARDRDGSARRWASGCRCSTISAR